MILTLEKVKKKWETYAEQHDILSHYKKSIKHKTMLKIIRNLINRTKNDIIVDLGCGEGIQLLTLQDKNEYSVGIDISRIFLLRFKNYSEIYNHSQKYNYIQADITHIPLKNNSIDICINSQVIEHIKNDYEVLKEIRRIIKKKSAVILSIPIKENFRDLLYIPLFKILLNKEWHGTDSTHLRLYSTKNLLKLTKKLNFIEPYYTNVGYPLPGFDILLYRIPLLRKIFDHYFIKLQIFLKKIFPKLSEIKILYFFSNK